VRTVPGAAANGVLALNQGASTPSSFVVRGEDAGAASLDALEYQAALQVVAGYAAGPLGAAAVAARRPSTDPQAIRAELRVVGEALALLGTGDGIDVVPVPRAQDALDRLRIDGSVLDGPELVCLRTTLAAARQVERELRRVAPRAPSLAALAVPVPERRLEQRLDQAFDPAGELLDSASPGLAAARREVIVARDRLVRRLEALLRGLDAQAVPGGASVTMREGRYVIPVRRDARSRPGGIIHDESASAGTLFVEPAEAIELGNALREAAAAEAREAHRVLRELTGLLRPERDALALAHAMCVAADDVLARARYARAAGGAVPEIGEPGGPVRLVAARHPLLLARSAATVPFDLALEPGERTLLVSGPNAGGKSVLLKATGLAATLAQAGIVPPVGTGSRIPVFTRLFTDIGDRQSIAADLSTFSAHLATLRALLSEADGHSLVLLDELGTGTDPSEGGALAWAVLEALTRRGALTVATTHLGALKTLASEEPGVVNGSLEFDSAALAPTYRFSKGVPGQSYGLAIARRLGVDPAVVARAEDRVPAQERALETLLADLESRDRAARARQAELEGREEDARRREEQVEASTADLAGREAALRRREREAERQARAQARTYLLEARQEVEKAIRLARGAADVAARDARRLVETAIQGAAPLEGPEAPGPGGDGPGESLLPGVRVRLAGGGIGRIESRRDDGRVVVLAGSARMVLPAAQIAAVLPDPAREPREPAVAREAHAAEAAFELDLRGMRVDEAEAAALAAIDRAVLAEQPYLRIIHGKGTGAVRERVHQVARADRRIASFALAPANQGGSGVTIVEFRQ